MSSPDKPLFLPCPCIASLTPANRVYLSVASVLIPLLIVNFHLLLSQQKPSAQALTMKPGAGNHYGGCWCCFDAYVSAFPPVRPSTLPAAGSDLGPYLSDSHTRGWML